MNDEQILDMAEQVFAQAAMLKSETAQLEERASWIVAGLMARTYYPTADERENEKLKAEVERLRAVIDEYAAADKKQRAALAKYADRDHWSLGFPNTHESIDRFMPTFHGWEIAEEALKDGDA